MVASGVETHKNNDHLVVGSFATSSCSGSGCVKVIKLLKWEECDTVGKMAGFIIGKAINFTATKGSQLYNKAVQLFYLDKVSHYFFRFMKRATAEMSQICRRISHYIKPLCVNETTRALASWAYDNVFTPLKRIVHRVAKFLFQTLLWDSVMVPLYKRVISPVFQKVFAHSRSSDRTENACQPLFDTLKTLSDWTLTPLYTRVLKPVAHTMGDCLHGILSGTLRTTPPDEESDKQRS